MLSMLHFLTCYWWWISSRRRWRRRERIVLKLAALLPQYGYRASILTFWAHPESAALQSPPLPPSLCCPCNAPTISRRFGLL